MAVASQVARSFLHMTSLMHKLIQGQTLFRYSNKTLALTPNPRLLGHGHWMDSITRRLLAEAS